ncbi:MAG: DUF488 domain-containing protein [Chloroflexi bacterium]|nr:DUF488 domain-containing protein [Chloroflexota bacterium]
MILHTIGFTQKSLRRFVELLRSAGVDAVIDVRLKNTGQLAGWSKRDDLEFILETFGIQYLHRPELAPTAELLGRYRDDGDWDRYEREFPKLIAERDVYESTLALLNGYDRPCFLCSEHEPKRCHRRLLADELQARQPGLQVVHLE